MIHLRTDLPLLPQQDMDGWVEDILENTHYRDIQSLRQKLDEAIESHYNGMSHASVTKKCDKCDRTYPEFIEKCACGNTNLGSYEIHYDID